MVACYAPQLLQEPIATDNVANFVVFRLMQLVYQAHETALLGAGSGGLGMPPSNATATAALLAAVSLLAWHGGLACAFAGNGVAWRGLAWPGCRLGGPECGSVPQGAHFCSFNSLSSGPTTAVLPPILHAAHCPLARPARVQARDRVAGTSSLLALDYRVLLYGVSTAMHDLMTTVRKQEALRNVTVRGGAL